MFQFDFPFEEHFITTADGERLNALLFKSSGPAKGLILYFHGNAGNLQRWGKYSPDFTNSGYDLLMIDYRGYGKSGGKPSEQFLYADATRTYHWVVANLPTSNLIIYGRSLGTAVASYLATQVEHKLLILETPFDELKGAVLPFFKPLFSMIPIKYRFPTKEHLARNKSRTVIFHGTNDRITPLSSALILKPLLKPGDEFIIIEKGHHGNLREFELYHNRLKQILLQSEIHNSNLP